MTPRLLLLALVLLAPAALARPYATWDDAGVAQPGSVEEWHDAIPRACPDVEVDVRVTLTILAGHPDDVLTLRLPAFPDHLVAHASASSPAKIEGRFPTACSGRFFVEGTSVAVAAAYAWHVEAR